MLISRPHLLKQIVPFYDDGLVKVITGMRRTGKSSLLRLIAEDKKRRGGLPENAFLFLNFELLTLSDLTDYQTLYAYIRKAIDRSPARLTVFLDEIQNVPNWELCVNSLRSENRCDIYVTGSNSKLLSGELATHLAGRFVRFRVFPFTFAEFCEARQAHRARQTDQAIDRTTLWNEYLLVGGMPGITAYEDTASAHLYLRDIFESIVLKDIAQRRNIRQTHRLEMLFRYLTEQIGHRISPKAIEQFLKSEKTSLSRDTILEYIDAGCEAFAFDKLTCADIKGKELLRFQSKVFAADHGFREALFPQSNLRDIDQVLENILCTHLMSHGWTLSIGQADGREVDFVAERNGEKRYFQVCYLLASPETEKREFSPLYQIQDNWPKYVLSLDPILRPRDGIAHENLVSFLLQDT